MTTRSRQYKSGPSLRTAIEERLKKISRDEAIDLQRLRRAIHSLGPAIARPRLQQLRVRWC